VKKIEAVIRPLSLDEVRQALIGAGLCGMTVSEVFRCAPGEARRDTYRGVAYTVDLVPRTKIEIAVPDCRASQVVDLVIRATRAGATEVGAIFVSPLADAIRIRTGEHGEAVLWPTTAAAH